jgi:hypothetical protein
MGTSLNSIVTFAESATKTQNDVKNTIQLDDVESNNGDSVDFMESNAQYNFECQGVVDYYEEDDSEVNPEDLISTSSTAWEIDSSISILFGY